MPLSPVCWCAGPAHGAARRVHGKRGARRPKGRNGRRWEDAERRGGRPGAQSCGGGPGPRSRPLGWGRPHVPPSRAEALRAGPRRAGLGAWERRGRCGPGAGLLAGARAAGGGPRLGRAFLGSGLGVASAPLCVLEGAAQPLWASGGSALLSRGGNSLWNPPPTPLLCPGLWVANETMEMKPGREEVITRLPVVFLRREREDRRKKRQGWAEPPGSRGDHGL